MNLALQIGWPQGIYLALTVIGLAHTASNLGKTTVIDAPSRIIATVIVLALLFWGGFFS